MQWVTLVLILIFLPLGELFRIPFANGISIEPLDIIIGFVGLYIVVVLLKNYQKNALKPPFWNPLLFFMFICVCSLGINSFVYPINHIAIGSLYLIRYFCYALLFYFVYRIPQSLKQKVRIGIILSGITVAVLGLFQYVSYPNLGNLYYAGWDAHNLRLFSTFLDPNFAGCYLVINFLFTLHYFFQYVSKRTWLRNTFFICSLFLLCSTILLTYSRSAFLALGAGLLIYLIPKGYKKFITVFGSVLILFLLFVIFLTSVPTEGAHLLRVPSSKARIDSFGHALVIFMDNPVIGTGFDLYRYAQERHHFLGASTWEISHSAAGTDNSLLFTLATTGILGLVIYLNLQWNIITYIVSTPYASVGLAIFGAFLTSSFFINGLFYPPLLALTWMIYGVIGNT